ncbi:MAG: outer membrane beta-barrel protein [Candidatus Cloacimonetes bacterium]|nr:outer membrane beta-barrel protein [Candidatus Cloacimonadota bacterium]
MKKIIILFSILLINSMLFSKFGGYSLQIGYHSSIFVGDDIPGKKVESLSGFNLGGGAEFEISRNLSFSQQILFCTKGSRANMIGDIYLYNFFLYLECPALLSITVPIFPQIQLLAGPAFNFKLLALNNDGMLNNVKSLDLTGNLGVRYNLEKFYFELRFSRGLINFLESDADLKNQTLSLNFGMRLK